MSGWGPERRRAAVSVSFESLGPALSTLLQILAERELSATFFADAEVARAESFALTMIAAGRNELGALVDEAAALAPALAALRATGEEIRGLRAVSAGAAPPPDELAALGLRYVQAPGGTPAIEDGVVRVPLDRRLRDAAFLAPGAWHEALQVAIGRAVEHGAHVTVTFFPGLLERADALAVFVETLDLLAGLRRAGRLWTPTLDELAAWRLEDAGR